MRLTLPTALLLWMLSFDAMAGKCAEAYLCVEDRRVGDEVHLVARNLSDFPLTATVYLRSYELRSSHGPEVTTTLPPGATRTINRFATLSEAPRYRYWFRWTVGDRDAEHDDSVTYLLPYREGASYGVLQGYGSRFSHTGLERYAVDFNMRVGTPVHAARDGVVAKVVEEHDRGCWEDGCGAYANYIVILHQDGTTAEYYHLRKDGAIVEVGQRVAAGQHIGYSGNTGHTTMPHLHFAVYRAHTWGRTQSIPVRFLTHDGEITRPRRGARYTAVSSP